MQGLDDDDWDDDFRPAPHPDDRLWRHPSEMAAQARADAMASADTVEVAAVPTLLPPPVVPTQSRRRLATVAAVSALIVGSTALLAGTVARPSATTEPVTETAALASAPIERSVTTRSAPAASAQSGSGVQPISAGAPTPKSDLAVRLHAQLAGSLPKIQVVTAEGMSEGGGFFLTPSGHIATSARLLRDSEYVIVWTDGNGRFEAEIMGMDMFSDVALIKIESESWPAADVAEQAKLHLGQSVLTLDHQLDVMIMREVASPFGTLRNEGHPSSPRVLITDFAQVGSATAGSAIVDENGAIVAMSNGLTDSPTGQSIATPAWLIERVALDMLVSGNSSHAWLGAEVAETGDGTSVTITEVQADSPAHRYGLQVGDRIERIDGTAVASLEATMRAIYTHNPNDEIDLMIVRDDSRRLVPITLGSLFN